MNTGEQNKMKIGDKVIVKWHKQTEMWIGDCVIVDFTAKFNTDEFYDHNIKNGINEAINWTKGENRRKAILEERVA